MLLVWTGQKFCGFSKGLNAFHLDWSNILPFSKELIEWTFAKPVLLRFIYSYSFFKKLKVA